MAARVILTRTFPDSVIARAKALFDTDIRGQQHPTMASERLQMLQDYDGILPSLGDAFSAEEFANAPARTRIIANFGVGYNHIDAKAAASHGIIVTNTPGVLTDATADIAVTLMLMTARRAGEGERLVRAGQWTGWHPTQLMGQDVSGQTVGIIGMGRIGQAMARRCHFGFGMRVIYYNRSSKTLDFPAEAKARLKDVMAEADIISLHMPGSPENHHLIGASELGAMKPTGILINTARGDVIDEAALVEMLEQGRLAGAGLDVYEQEPHVPSRLCALENTVVLPHLGSATLGVREAMGHMALDNLEAFFDGRPVPNPV